MKNVQVMPIGPLWQGHARYPHAGKKGMPDAARHEAWPTLSTDEEDEGFIRSSN
ncbi:hypothetical protein [Marinobacterium maritimum]|uniref:hypothetical protein n=1 Tax=Marinobacterium maritimum TaxID=500162 RepID=UPI0031D35CDE